MSNLSVSSKPSKEGKPWWFETASTCSIALVAIFILRSFVVESRYIPSASMLPNYEVGDRFLVDKLTPNLWNNYERGNVVVFQSTPKLSQTILEVTDGKLSIPHDEAMIKRIVAVEGDKVTFVSRDNQTLSKIVINDEAIEEPYIQNQTILIRTPSFVQPNKVFVVPENSFLVLGDNRNNSADSRYFGFINRDQILGKASFRFWPLDRLGLAD